jgi:hypothetical protein
MRIDAARGAVFLAFFPAKAVDFSSVFRFFATAAFIAKRVASPTRNLAHVAG